MTLRDEHDLFRMRLSHPKSKEQPPSVHGSQCQTQKRGRRAGGSGSSYRVDEARFFELQLEVLALRQKLEVKDEQLQSRASYLVTAGDYIKELRQKNESLEGQLAARTKEVESLRQESNRATDELNLRTFAEAATRELKEQEHLKVIEKSQQMKADFGWIILRNLVDKVQTQLTVTAGIVGADSNVSRRSLAWREALNGKNRYNTDKRRMQTAKSLLSASKDVLGIPAAAFSLLNSAAGHLVTDNNTELRQKGDQVAHRRLYIDDVMEAISSIETTPQLEEGIKILADFLGLY